MVTGNARTKAEFPGVVERSSVPRSRMLKGNDAGRGRRGGGGKIERKDPVKREAGIFQGTQCRIYIVRAVIAAM